MQIIVNRLRTVLANEQLPEQMPANDILLDPQQLATLWARFQFYRVVLLPTGLPLLLNAQRYAQITRSRAVVDQLRGKPRPSGRGKDSADGVAVLAFAVQCGVRCCSMYWRMISMGAPPQLPAKYEGDHSAPPHSFLRMLE